MKQILIAIVVMLFMCSIAAAQTCTPVKLGTTYTNKDDGTGPYFTFSIDGTWHAQRSTINLTATYFNTYVIYHGYVDVFALYGGCTQSWYINGFNYYYGLYDLTTHKWVGDSPEQTPIEDVACGFVPSCAFYNTGNNFTYGVTPGHSYNLWGFVSMGTSVGSTDWYNDYLTINVQ